MKHRAKLKLHTYKIVILFYFRFHEASNVWKYRNLNLPIICDAKYVPDTSVISQFLDKDIPDWSC